MRKAGENQKSKMNPSVSNWMAFQQGEPWLASAEYPLFTDASCTGELILGPYSFMNTVAHSTRKVVKIGLAPDVSYAHGGLYLR
jgi:hypothetical protein